MSLNYELSKIENWREVCLNSEGNLNPTTHSLIFALMAIGCPNITERNFATVWERLQIAEGVIGAYRNCNGEPKKYTRAEITAHIGLETNVSKKTDLQFYRTLTNFLERWGS